jgi:hypothetical protein
MPLIEDIIDKRQRLNERQKKRLKILIRAGLVVNNIFLLTALVGTKFD